MRFQPIVHLPSGDLYGIEALCRWQGDDGEFISPEKFVPIAESHGLVGKLGDWIFRSSIEAFASLPGRHEMFLTVNASILQLESGFAHRIATMCEKSNIDPAQVGIELTESEILQDFYQFCESVTDLKDAGFKILIDDFGTGQSSLFRLEVLPFDVLKLDGHFSAGIHVNTRTQAIVKSIVALTKDLGRSLIAERVETQAEAKCLIDLGCDLAQGYFFSKPLPINQMSEFAQRSSYQDEQSA